MAREYQSCISPPTRLASSCQAAPLYGDLTGLPLLIQVGSRETLLDDAVRMAERAKKAGVPVELDLWEGQIHVWQIFASRLDEGEQAIQNPAILGTRPTFP